MSDNVKTAKIIERILIFNAFNESFINWIKEFLRIKWDKYFESLLILDVDDFPAYCYKKDCFYSWNWSEKPTKIINLYFDDIAYYLQLIDYVYDEETLRYVIKWKNRIDVIYDLIFKK